MTTCSNIPDWAKGAIFYQIFVDRFCKSSSHRKNLVKGRNYREWGEIVDWKRNVHGKFHNNDFFCGDINGICEKICYFKKLGVQVLYLSPITFSKYRYDRYATTDFNKIDPDAGTFEDLKRLHEVAKKNNIHIILDMAFNHCCTNNQMYVDAFMNPDSIYRDWFKRKSNGQISYWYGFDDMPEFNQYNSEYQKYIFGEGGIIEKYSNYVDGFRLDLAENLEPFFINGINQKANEKTPHLIVGEYWKNADRSVIESGLSSVTCYPMTNAILKFLTNGDSEYLQNLMENLVRIYPQDTLDSLLISLDTHDIPRSITMLGKKQLMRNGLMDFWDIDKFPTIWHQNGDFKTDEFREWEAENDILTSEEYENATDLLKVGAVLQYFYIGSPCMYYGTEAGLCGMKDPFNRKCYPWGHEDKKLLSFFMELGQFRHTFDSRNANPRIIFRDSGIFVFERENKDNSVFVAVNRTREPRKIKVPEKFIGGQSFNFNIWPQGKVVTMNSLDLLSYGAIVIKK